MKPPEEIKEILLGIHKSDAKAHSMVYSVWEDGEITLEKGGVLFGLRNLHMIKGGSDTNKLPSNLFPVTEGTHGRVFVNTMKEAEDTQSMIWELSKQLT